MLAALCGAALVALVGRKAPGGQDGKPRPIRSLPTRPGRW